MPKATLPDFGLTEAQRREAVRGCGMIVNFPKGKGEVFHVGSTEWIAGLIKEDAMVEPVTRNILDRYLAKSAS